jgi:MSHA biogenesis protein MshM
MYLNHFHLTAPPFSITPDTEFTYGSRAQLEALNTLLLAIDDGEGFIKITGEVGTGKTLACRRFLATLACRSSSNCAGFDSVYIPNPQLTPRTLLLAIAHELQLPVRPDAPEHELLTALNRAVLKAARDGRRVVVCLDEAQAMPIDTMEALRLLSNLETEKRKLVQVVLFGQPELDVRLARTELRQLASRISFQYRLGALSADETERYLAHRLRVAGYRGDALFQPAVARALHRVTRGVPRLINIVAHKALLLAYGEGALRVNVRQVKAAAADTPYASRLGLVSRWIAALFHRHAADSTHARATRRVAGV